MGQCGNCKNTQSKDWIIESIQLYKLSNLENTISSNSITESTCNSELLSKLAEKGEFISTTEFEQLITSLSPSVKQSMESIKNFDNVPEFKDFITFPSKHYDNTYTLSPIKWNNNSIYHGSFNVEGNKHGYGEEISSDGSFYKGYYNDNSHDYFGMHIWSNSNYYIGDISLNKHHGKGWLYVCDQVLYKGEFSEDHIHGYGYEKNFKDETQYYGAFDMGIKKGNGKLIFNDGTYYEGEFKDGKYNGNGKICYFDGRKYEGGYCCNNMHGFGKFSWPDGSYYEGNYINNMKSGKGKFFWNDNYYYIGNWRNNQQNGEGAYYINNVETKVIFRYGKYIGKSVLI